MQWVSAVAALVVVVAAAQCTATAVGDMSAPVVAVRVDGSSRERPRMAKQPEFLQDEVAWGQFVDEIDTSGWSYFEVHTNAAFSDQQQAYAAGLIEGNLSAVRIYQNYINNGLNESLNDKLQSFLNSNIDFMTSSIANLPNLPQGSFNYTYWYHIDLVLTQLEGMTAGYAMAAPSLGLPPLSFMDFFRINLGGDMEDLEDAFSNAEVPKSKLQLFMEAGHCSALLKLLPNNADLFVSQVTWSSFNSMLRTFKLYDMPYTVSGDSSNTVPAVKASFSSYPGVLNSMDDFYVLSNGLIVQETTIGNSNPDLYKYIVPSSILEFIRNIVANRLSTDIASWSDCYSLYNSGTYNNQNMIVDTKKFTQGQKLVQGTFSICEQIPGTIICNDLSDKLETDRYFGSYNTAYDPVIRNLSHVDQAEQMYGDWFSYNNTARAQIFRRNQSSIATLEDMKRMMRYNDFKNDPLSTQMGTCQFLKWTNCTPPYTSENAIATRGDLNDPAGVYSLPMFTVRNHVATDAKITSVANFDKSSLTCYAISGPTNDQQPTFSFSKSPYANVSHMGLPDTWNFPWVTVHWT